MNTLTIIASGETDEQCVDKATLTSFDYTKWREKNLFTGMSVKEISKAAQEYCDTFPDE